MEQPVYRIRYVTLLEGTLDELGFVDDNGKAENQMLEWARKVDAVVEKQGQDNWELLNRESGV